MFEKESLNTYVDINKEIKYYNIDYKYFIEKELNKIIKNLYFFENSENKKNQENDINIILIALQILYDYKITVNNIDFIKKQILVEYLYNININEDIFLFKKDKDMQEVIFHFSQEIIVIKEIFQYNNNLKLLKEKFYIEIQSIRIMNSYNIHIKNCIKYYQSMNLKKDNIILESLFYKILIYLVRNIGTDGAYFEEMLIGIGEQLFRQYLFHGNLEKILDKNEIYSLLNELCSDKFIHSLGTRFFGIIKFVLKDTETIEFYPLTSSHSNNKGGFETKLFFKFLVSKKFQENWNKIMYSIHNKKIWRPMICYPKDWDCSVSLLNNNTGGFLLNDILYNRFYVKSSIENKHIIEIMDKSKNFEYFNNINKLQKVAYKLNNNLYEFYCKNLSYIIYIIFRDESIYLLENKYFDNDLKIYLLNLEKYSKEEDSKLILECLNNFYLKVKEYINKEKNKEIKDNNLLKFLLNLKTYINKIYTKYKNIEILLEKYKTVKNNVFYFPISIDSWSRSYYDCTWFSAQGSKLSRSLLFFEIEKSYDIEILKVYLLSFFKKKDNILNLNFLEDLINIYIYDIYKFITFVFFETKEPFLFLGAFLEYINYLNFNKVNNKNEEYKSGFIIYADSTASGPQIISIICLIDTYKKELNLTNCTTLGDLYTELMRKFFYCTKIKKKIENDINNYILSKYNNNTDKVLKTVILKENLEEFLKFFNIVNKKLLKNDDVTRKLLALFRKLQKKNIMTLNYGLSLSSYRNAIYSNLNLLNEIIYIVFENENNENNDYRKLWYLFIDFTYDFFKETELFNFQKSLRSYAKINNEFNLPSKWKIPKLNNVDYNYEFNFSLYHKKKTTHRNEIEFKCKRKITAVMKMYKDELDKMKQTNSLYAHFIHSIDAFIMYNMMGFSNFQCVFIFDCIGLHPAKQYQFMLDLRKFYQNLIRDWNLGSSLKNSLDTFLTEIEKDVMSQNKNVNSIKKFKDIIDKNFIKENLKPEDLDDSSNFMSFSISQKKK